MVVTGGHRVNWLGWRISTAPASTIIIILSMGESERQSAPGTLGFVMDTPTILIRFITYDVSTCSRPSRSAP
jgi:hypothetical protein